MSIAQFTMLERGRLRDRHVGDGAPNASLSHPSEFDGYEQLAAMANDPAIRRHARRLAGDLAEDVLQETWYHVAQVCQRGSIDNPSGYFYRTLVNTARHMRQELGRVGTVTDDPAREAESFRRGQDRRHAIPSAEREAMQRMRAQARQDALQRNRAELSQRIPAYSADPDRYRTAILAVAAWILTDNGPINRAEINEALRAAYPAWFDTSEVKADSMNQRRCRGGHSNRLVLGAVVGRDDLLP